MEKNIKNILEEWTKSNNDILISFRVEHRYYSDVAVIEYTPIKNNDEYINIIEINNTFIDFKNLINLDNSELLFKAIKLIKKYLV